MGVKKYRKGVFCAIYAIEKGKPIYLLLHRKLHWKGWEFCKGGLKANEKLENCAIREVREESGLKVINLEKFNIKGKFKYDEKTRRERKARGFSYILFSCRVARGKVKISRKEHDNYKWCNYDRAVKMLAWQNQKKCLKIANTGLKR